MATKKKKKPAAKKPPKKKTAAMQPLGDWEDLGDGISTRRYGKGWYLARKKSRGKFVFGPFYYRQKNNQVEGPAPESVGGSYFSRGFTPRGVGYVTRWVARTTAMKRLRAWKGNNGVMHWQ